jgi:hypothetical protein
MGSRRRKEIMRHINSVIASIGWSLVVIAITAFSPALTHGQKAGAAPPPATLDVKVVNSPSEAVPVTGTVNVGNLGAVPLPVRDVDGPARQPVQFRDSYVVPAGKRLVIEYISAEFRIAGPCQFMVIELFSAPQRLHYFYPHFVGTIPNPNGAEYVYGLSQGTKAYVDENKVAYLSFLTAGGCDLNTNFKYASGFLVDM